MCVLIYSNIIACTDSLYFYGPVYRSIETFYNKGKCRFFHILLESTQIGVWLFQYEIYVAYYIISCQIQNRILLCNKQEKIYCLQHNIIKFITLLLPCNGVSLKIILIILKPNLLEVVMYIHVFKLNFLHRGNIFHT